MSSLPVVPESQSSASSYDYNALEFALGFCTFILFCIHQITILLARKHEVNGDDDLNEPLTSGENSSNDNGNKWKRLAAINTENIWPSVLVFFMAKTFAAGLVADSSTKSDNETCIKALTVLIWLYTISYTFYVPFFYNQWNGLSKMMYVIALLSSVSCACMMPYLITTYYIPNEDDFINNN